MKLTKSTLKQLIKEQIVHGWGTEEGAGEGESPEEVLDRLISLVEEISDHIDSGAPGSAAAALGEELVNTAAVVKGMLS